MNQLITSNIEMTSLEIAEVTGKEHYNIMRDIRKEITSLGSAMGQLIFEESTYINIQNKEQPCYKLNKKGAMQLALKYDAKTRFKVIERIEELEGGNQPKPLTEKEQLRASLRLSLETSEEVEVLKEDVAVLKDKVENQITLDHGEQRGLQKAVARKVYELEVHEQLRPRLFREIYREIKDRFGVASYKDVKRKDLQAAVNYVNAWLPRKVS